MGTPEPRQEQRHFHLLEGLSSRSEQQELQYQTPVDATGGACNQPHDQPLDNLQPAAPVQASGGGNGAQQQVYNSGAGVDWDNISPGENLKSQVNSEVPKDDPDNEGTRSVMVVRNPPTTAIKPESGALDTHNGLQGETHSETKLREKPCKPRYVGLIILVIALGVVILFGSTAVVCRFTLPDNHECELTSYTVEILQNNTVLAYRGNASNLEITASFQTNSAMQQLSVNLYVVDCDELNEHKKHITIHDKVFPLTENIPYSIPAGYRHYEVGSTFNYSVTSNQVPAGSNLSVLLFNNTTEADYYKNNHMDPMARAKAIRVEPVPIDTSYTFCYDVTYGSYYIPIFQITGEDFDIDLSYSITQVFYLSSDYVPYTNCSLSSNETCSFDFSTRNETCVLTYNFPQKNAVLLSASIKTENDKVPPFKANVHIVAYIFLAVFICLLSIAVIFLARKIKMKCSTTKCTYRQLPKQRSTVA